MVGLFLKRMRWLWPALGAVLRMLTLDRVVALVGGLLAALEEALAAAAERVARKALAVPSLQHHLALEDLQAAAVQAIGAAMAAIRWLAATTAAAAVVQGM